MDGRSEQDHEPTECADAIPAEVLPAQGSGIGSDGACREVADHVDHVQAAARFGKQTVDPCLVRNVPSLHSTVQKNDTEDEANHVIAVEPKNDEGENRDDERNCDIAAHAMTIGSASYNRRGGSTHGAHQSKESGDAAAVVIGRLA